MIVFPTSNSLFNSFGPDGISMVLLTTFIAQAIYAMGFSVFRGSNGGFMMEVIPFLHSM